MDTKERILQAVTEMLKTQSEETITMRSIAQKVDITLSVINYHFQSKQVLIETAIKRMIGMQVAVIEKSLQEMEAAPLMDKIQKVWDMISYFMVRESKFARISILSDFKSENGTLDNTLQIHTLLKDLIMKESKLDLEEKAIHLLLHQMGVSLQVMFLRAAVLKQNFDMDFYDDEERVEIVHQMVENLFHGRI